MSITRAARHRAKKQRASLATKPSGATGDNNGQILASSAAGEQPLTRLVPLSDIDRDGQNHRLDAAQVKKAVSERADSFRRVGQLTPVRIYARSNGSGNKYLLDSGFIRCAAAELLGWKDIRAEILPMPEERLQVETTRAAENLDRLGLNPMEEAVAVAQMLESLPATGRALDGEPSLWRDEGGKATPAAIEHIAARLGRTPTWVRDRAYLDRLCPKVRKWVMDGSLALGFAREIAKLGDHGDQEDIAEHARIKDDGKSWSSFHDVRSMVDQRMRSLKIVPWPLDARDWPKDKRIVGPCVNCPHNTSTDRNLFEHDSKSPDDGYCLNGGCFEAKQQACREAVDKAVAQIAKKELPATESSASAVLSPKGIGFVKPATIARAAKKQLNPDAGGGRGRAGSRAPEKSYEDLVRDAEWKFRNAMNEWNDQCRDRIYEAAMQRPGGTIVLALASLTRATRWNATVTDFQAAKPALEILFKDGAVSPNLIEFAKSIDVEEVEFKALRNQESPLRGYIAGKWGITFDSPPNKADFMPPKPAEKPGAKGSAKAKRGKVPDDAADIDDEGGSDDED